MTGASHLKASSSSIERIAASAGASALFCIATGLIAVIIDAAFHLPLRLPGHHGLTQMALLVAAACVTRRPWAATLSAASSAAAVAGFAGLGFSPLTPALYLLSGLAVDGCRLGLRTWRDSVWLLAAAAALGNSAKAVALWFAGDVVSAHGILTLNGFAYSLLSHLAFGGIGGLIAAGLWSATRKRLRSPD
ncbi:MAG: hypothetical protein KGJ66_07310 [Alphaproteobacteria bacterium]|nr:hypothetical protein [Alphaproteobacteria bacterium]